MLIGLGHDVRIMVSKAVKAFVNRNKSDFADAKEIWMAVQQPVKCVAVKTEAQQAILALHRMLQQLIKFRTMQINGLRDLLAEYGEVMGVAPDRFGSQEMVIRRFTQGRPTRRSRHEPDPVGQAQWP